MKKIIIPLLILSGFMASCMPTTDNKALSNDSAYQAGDKVRYSNENFIGTGMIDLIKTTKDGISHYIIDVGKGVEVDFKHSQLK